MRIFRGIWFCVCIFIGIQSALAEIKESKNSIVLAQNHSFIKVIAENSLGPETLSKRQVYLLVRLGAAYADIVVCAQPSKSAKGLATTLANGMGISDAVYSQEDDYAAAEAEISFGKLFSQKHEWDFDINQVKRAFQDAGWEVFGGVKINSDSVAGVPASPITVTKTHNDYSLESLTKAPVHLHAAISPIIVVLPFFVFFGPSGVLLISFLVAYAFAKRKDLDVARRRKLFANLIRFPLFGTMALCLPLSMFVIFGGLLVPVADLWFGSPNQAGAFIPVVMGGMPLLILLFIPISRVETRLFSNAPDKLNFETAQFVPVAGPSRKPQIWLGLTFVAIGAAVQFGGIFYGGKGGVRMTTQLLGFAIMFGGMPLSALILARTRKGNPLESSSDPLAKRVIELSKATKTDVLAVDVIEPRDQAQGVAVTLYSGRLSITRKAIDELSDSGMDFAIAHALAAKTGRSVLTMFAVILPFALIFAGIQSWVRSQTHATSASPFFLMLPMLLMPVLMLPVMFKVIERDRFRNMRDTLKLVPNVQAAEEWIEKSCAQSPTNPMVRRTEKYRESLLKVLSEAGKALGLA